MIKMLIVIPLAMMMYSYILPVVPEPVIVAHRGASYYAPENTIPAFMLAWEQGADAIEGDFFLTADGEIVCIHDPYTGRVAETSMVVSESSLRELKELNVGSWKGKEFGGATIPAIAEVFEIVPSGRKIFVEIKTGTEILPRLYEEIERAHLLPGQIVIISFNSEVIKEFKAARPMHKALWLSGISRDEQGNPVPYTEAILETLENAGADGFSSNYRPVTPEIIDAVIDAGYEYHVWTVNDASTAKAFKHYGASSITTDRPGFIRENLNPRKWRPLLK